MRPAKIAACLIVKNEVQTVERCLRSLRPFVDEVNVYDTGSTDGTLELLARLSAADAGAPLRVVHGEWRDDFAWAREQSFAMASDEAEWLLWTDADDEVEGAKELRAAVAEAPPQAGSVAAAYDEAVADYGQPRIRTWRDRLVRADAGFVWRGTVHEYLAPPPGSERVTHAIDPARVRWIHKPLGEWEPERNFELLHADVDRAASTGTSTESRTQFHLALESFWFGDFTSARPLLERWLEAHREETSDAAATATNRLAACHRMTGAIPDAIALELEAFRRRPDWRPTAVGLTQSYAAARDWPNVIEWATRAVAIEPPRSGVPLSYVEVLLVPHLRLAEAELRSGRTDDAKAAVRAAADAAPGSALLTAHRRHFDELVDAGENDPALKHLGAMIGDCDETMRATLRGLAAKMGGLRGEQGRRDAHVST
jgi:hypothetical protein